MLDNPLMALIIPIITGGLTTQGFATVSVKQAYQPVAQGANTGATVYLHKITDRPYGYLQRDDYVDEVEPLMVHQETQIYETTYQVNALVRQLPADINSITASDLVRLVSLILQSDLTRTTLLASGVQILRVSELRNPRFLDDRDQFEESPSFDFTLTHQQTTDSLSPVIVKTELKVYELF